MKDGMKRILNILYRLLFTRDDDLDLLQLFFLLIIVYFIVAFSLVGAGIWFVTNMAWTTFISVFATLAIAGTPKWIANLLSKNRNKNNPTYYHNLTNFPEELHRHSLENTGDDDDDESRPEIG